MSDTLYCTIVTPEKVALDARADFVAVPLYDGEIGIASGRAPLIGRLGFGEMRIKVADKVTRYYLDGGFVQVADNIVSILTNRAVLASEVNAGTARQLLDESMKLPITTVELEEIRDRNVAQARAQLRIAERI